MKVSTDLWDATSVTRKCVSSMGSDRDLTPGGRLSSSRYEYVVYGNVVVSLLYLVSQSLAVRLLLYISHL